MVGPQCYGFYPINHGILRIYGKYRPGTKKLQTTLQQDLKTENLSDDMVMEEYFERDVKFEVDSSIKLERSAILKHESLSDNDDELEEYFEKEVKSEVYSDIDHD